ncbi:Uncharacterised protein [Campylobacter hyointestinalis subsp. hyointestinalis]|uniref:Uncharacterized protein n=1 Tax=Campylobacter hyointestinalis subsp. hyointestinalis TaxID=91352 RepID=A0A855NBQ6_CAMHY|nr:hypothetical protein [Campylobacter hyointestinalis]PPB55964.1 hypothetical protein CDQ70_09205 [Campylobacter hyointestinalis subsp. hyointestinalis]PPB70037.1 hypothetical protein CDQ78_09185 [Campylobacter hyointestinalis subsp. hyointestinalis]TWO22944.1 hypothetical protein YZ80_01500 [Campylobacter hyointestinalis]CUU72766.1 Uncharacterised protein [Campylobacter hyointestinalis subsp. hyointestinalis]CUU72767.1 Uncharacterised protein [Campylobacter hyointestinalis subsp. hyointestin
MLNEFLNFLGFSNKATCKNQLNTDNTDIKENVEMQEYIVEMRSSDFKEEITTETVIKDGKKIEIQKIKTTEPLNNGKTLITTKIYKKDITRM